MSKSFDPTQALVEHIISNTKELPAPKIEALARVIEAVRGHAVKDEAPNQVKSEEPGRDISDDSPIPFDEILGFQVDGGKIQPVNLEPSATQGS